MSVTTGGTPKLLGDGNIVLVRPDYGQGGSDLWATRDVVIGFLDEFDRIYGALAASATYAAFKAALATNRQFVKLKDFKGGAE